MKNDVGYELADANVKLPEALQYAKEEAVQEQEDRFKRSPPGEIGGG